MAFNTESMLLRRVLQANAVFSTISGFALIGTFKPLSSVIGLERSWILVLIGVLLLFFAVGLVRNSRRDNIDEKEVVQAIVSDGVWVLGSAIVAFIDVLTAAGNWLVGSAALAVLTFAMLQCIGLDRLRHRRPAQP